MFESAELGHKLSKAEYAEIEPVLRTELLETQLDLLDKKDFAAVVLINGIDGAGRGETVNLLNEWMDPRHIEVHAFDRPTDEERERPFLWRFWRALPPRGKIGILFNNWYSEPLGDRAFGRIKKARLDQRLSEFNRFEAMLAAEGVVLVKFWFHLSRDGQKKRLKALEANPATRWRVRASDRLVYDHYDRYRATAEHVLRRTSTAHSPWVIVDGSDPQYRAVFVGRTLLQRLQAHLEHVRKGYRARLVSAPLVAAADRRTLLNALALDQPMERKAYEAQREALQGRLSLALRRRGFTQRSLVLVFEGMDAAGKGGAIRRVTQALDTRQYHVIPIAAPSDEERAQPYLWRFWRRLPRRGRVAIFDRSWYGRVLVERVEGFCTEADWMRAYAEINDFEDQLVSHGALVVKFWLSISADEQLRRFKAREEAAFKRYKITPDDWRNREKWPLYEPAVCDMIDRTSTENAPWTLVEADNKYFARLKILRTIVETVERSLKA
ncbi:MAG TPA: polyphosphate:AMP phosphotransferase [Rhodocyclaceae bacterium]|nr:polyphosphate:AMP phosphotransferase [Rhodocyclaceae bacterium]